MIAEELIQIVDEHDNPIGSATRQQAWEQGLIHRIAGVVIEDPNGKILLQKRAATKSTWPNSWDTSAAGHVAPGEDYLAAALRELGEEVGLAGVELKPLGNYFSKVAYDGMQPMRFNQVYRVVVPAETEWQLQAAELSEVRWFSLSDIRQLITEHPDEVTDGLIDVMQHFYT